MAPVNPLALAINNRLPQPCYKIVTVRKLMDLIAQGRLILDAAFQRDAVWSKSDCSAYLSSVFAGAPTGQIVLVRVGNRWVVLDGKQRIGAFVAFFDGSVTVRDDESALWAWKSRPRCRLIKAGMRETCTGIQITLVKYPELTDKQQRQLFQAMQMGLKLTSSQKLHGALRTPRKLLAESVINMYQVKFETSFGFETARGETLELIIMRVVHMMVSGNKSFISAKSLLKWISLDGHVKMSTEDRVWESMILAVSALEMPGARLPGEEQGCYTLAPVEIILSVLFAQEMFLARRHTHNEPRHLANGLRQLRQRLRRKFPGVVRANNNVLKYGVAFIKPWMRDSPPKDETATLDMNVSKRTSSPTAPAGQLCKVEETSSIGSRKKRPMLVTGEIIDLTLEDDGPTVLPQIVGSVAGEIIDLT